MPDKVDLIVKNGRVVTSQTDGRADIAISGGKFVAIAAPGELGLDAKETYDADGKVVIPGVIDGHVHFREPGFEYKEDWRTGSTAAVHGGVTMVIDMPNTNPKTDTVEGVELKTKLAEEKSFVDFGIIGLLVQDSVPNLKPIAAAGVCGYKCFLGETIGKIPAPDDGMMLDGLKEIAETGLRIGFHAENNEIMQHLIRKFKAEGRKDWQAHVDSRPALAEVESIQRMGLFARAIGTRIHIFHLSSADGLDMIDDWRAKGVDVTCETGAHYVFKKAEDMDQTHERLRMNPPVRWGREGHGPVLLEGLKTGRVNMIATDHSPHTAEEKLTGDIWTAISGYPQVEISVRLWLTHAINTGKMTLQQFVKVTSENPAKVWDLWPQKGALQVGSDGDLTILDLDQTGVIRDDELHSKNHVTPFDGDPYKGNAVGTIVRGRVIMKDGQLMTDKSDGKLVRPNKTASTYKGPYR
jgi:allantoinase